MAAVSPRSQASEPAYDNEVVTKEVLQQKYQALRDLLNKDPVPLTPTRRGSPNTSRNQQQAPSTPVRYDTGPTNWDTSAIVSNSPQQQASLGGGGGGAYGGGVGNYSSMGAADLSPGGRADASQLSTDSPGSLAAAVEELHFTASQLSRVRKELDKAERRADTLESTLAAESSANASTQAENKRLKSKLDQTEAQLQTAQRALQLKDSEIEARVSDLARMKASLMHHREVAALADNGSSDAAAKAREIERLTSELDATAAELANARAATIDAEATVRELQRSLSDSDRAMLQCNAALRTAQHDLATTRAELERARDSLADVNATNAELELRARTAQWEANQANAALQESQAAHRASARALGNAQQEIEFAQRSASARASASAELGGGSSATAAELAAARNTIARQQAAIDALNAELASLGSAPSRGPRAAGGSSADPFASGTSGGGGGAGAGAGAGGDRRARAAEIALQAKSDDLQSAELTVSRLQAELGRVTDAAAAAEADHDAAVRSLKSELERARTAAASAEDKSHSLQLALSRTEKDRDAARATADSAEKQVAELQAYLRAVKKERDGAATSADDKDAAVHRLELELKRERAESQHTLRQMSSLEVDMESMRKALAAARAEAADAGDRVAESEGKIRELNAELRRANAEVKEIQFDADGERDKARALAAKLAAAQADAADAAAAFEARIKGLETDLRRARVAATAGSLLDATAPDGLEGGGAPTREREAASLATATRGGSYGDGAGRTAGSGGGSAGGAGGGGSGAGDSGGGPVDPETHVQMLKDIVEASRALQEKEEALQAAEYELSVYRVDAAHADRVISEKEAAIEELTAELAATQEALDAANAELEDKASKVSALSGANAAAAAASTSVTAAQDDLQRAVFALQEKETELEAERAARESSASLLRKALSELEGLRRQLDIQERRVEASEAAVRSKAASARLGVVADAASTVRAQIATNHERSAFVVDQLATARAASAKQDTDLKELLTQVESVMRAVGETAQHLSRVEIDLADTPGASSLQRRTLSAVDALHDCERGLASVRVHLDLTRCAIEANDTELDSLLESAALWMEQLESRASEAASADVHGLEQQAELTRENAELAATVAARDGRLNTLAAELSSHLESERALNAGLRTQIEFYTSLLAEQDPGSAVHDKIAAILARLDTSSHAAELDRLNEEAKRVAAVSVAVQTLASTFDESGVVTELSYAGSSGPGAGGRSGGHGDDGDAVTFASRDLIAARNAIEREAAALERSWDNNAARTLIAKLQSQLDEEAARGDDAARRCAALKHARAGLHDKIDQLTIAADAARSRYEQKLEEKDAEIARLSGTEDDPGADDRLAAVTASLTATQEAYADLQAELASLKRGDKSMDDAEFGTADPQRLRADALEASLKEANAKVESLTKENDLLNAKLTAADATLNATGGVSGDEAAALREELATAKGEVEANKRVVASKNAEIADLEAQLASARSTASKETARADDLAIRVATLEDEATNGGPGQRSRASSNVGDSAQPAAPATAGEPAAANAPAGDAGSTGSGDKLTTEAVPQKKKRRFSIFGKKDDDKS